MIRMFTLGVVLGALLPALPAQEADSGVDLRATVAAQGVFSKELTEAPRSGAPFAAGSRTLVYPTIKFDEHWSITGAGQLATRPFFYSDFSTEGYGAKGALLQATLNYARIGRKGSLLARAGEMSSAFGSFLLRYGDAENSLIDVPQQYGYYYAPISILPVAGAQIDATRGRFDGRVQFANSSPANPRSVFARDQYGNWAGGGGFTIHEGFRVGASAYRGPYLDRHYAYFVPGEINPSRLPAHAFGVDGNWTHGHTVAFFEAQRFVMPYTIIPNFRETAGYAEVRQALNPHLFVAFRYGLNSTNFTKRTQSLESAFGYRAGRDQLVKVAYEFEHYEIGTEKENHTLGIQYVITLHASAAHE